MIWTLPAMCLAALVLLVRSWRPGRSFPALDASDEVPILVCALGLGVFGSIELFVPLVEERLVLLVDGAIYWGFGVPPLLAIIAMTIVGRLLQRRARGRVEPWRFHVVTIVAMITPAVDAVFLVLAQIPVS